MDPTTTMPELAGDAAWLHSHQYVRVSTNSVRGIVCRLYGMRASHPTRVECELLHDGELVGSRLRRSLWSLERSEPVECDICGDVHAQPPEKEAYRVVVVASERITDEDWFGLSLPDSTRRVCAVSFFRLAVSIPEVQILPTTNRLGAFDKEPSQRRQDPEPRICTELAA